MATIDGINEVVLYFNGHFHLRGFHILSNKLYASLDMTELIDEVFLPVGHEFLQCLDVLLGECEHGLGLEGDGITHVAALPAGQTGLAFLDGFAHHAHQLFVGIGTSLVNLQSGVTATESFQRDLHGSIFRVGFHFLVIQCGCDVDTTGRTNHELAPCLGVEVEENVALQLAAGKCVSTEHACFLIGSDECLHRTVLHVFRLHHGHDGSYAQTVVGTEGCSLGLHPFAVNPGFNGIGFEVVGRFGSLLRHHVHVCLQDDAFAVFHAGSSRGVRLVVAPVSNCRSCARYIPASDLRFRS